MANSNIGFLDEITNDIKKKASKAVQMTRDEIYEAVHTYLFMWYADYAPKMYKRTYEFLNSLIKLDVSINGNSIHTEVKISEDYLGHTYSDGEQPSGLEVANWANKAFHGVKGETQIPRDVSFWTDAINALGGEAGIEAILKKNLKACGL